MVKSEYHKKRTQRGIEMRLAFAEAYNRLFRGRVKDGETIHGIKVRAAAMAGFGENSATPKAAYKAQRVKAAQMMKDPVVISRLEELGLRPHPFQKYEWVISDGER